MIYIHRMMKKNHIDKLLNHSPKNIVIEIESIHGIVNFYYCNNFKSKEINV